MITIGDTFPQFNLKATVSTERRESVCADNVPFSW